MTFTEWADLCPSMSLVERELAGLAWDAALEQAAKACDMRYQDSGYHHFFRMGADNCIAEIRKLKVNC